LAGWLGSSAGIVPTLLVFAVITLAGVMIARRIWPANDADVLPINIRNCNPSIPTFRVSRRDTRMPTDRRSASALALILGSRNV
jgi:hypothetical protein